MTEYFYETKESTADGFRACVVTPFEDGNSRRQRSGAARVPRLSWSPTAFADI